MMRQIKQLGEIEGKVVAAIAAHPQTHHCGFPGIVIRFTDDTFIFGLWDRRQGQSHFDITRDLLVLDDLALIAGVVPKANRLRQKRLNKPSGNVSRMSGIEKNMNVSASSLVNSNLYDQRRQGKH